MIKKYFALALIVSLFIVPAALAHLPQGNQSQQSLNKRSPAETTAEKERRDALEKKALALLDEAMKEAQTLHVPENRVRLEATAADMLWSRDQKRARALFKLATDGLVEAQREEESFAQQYAELEGFDTYQGPYRLQYLMRLQQLMQLRQEILNLISRHDARLAREFLAATRLEAQETRLAPYGLSDADQHFELNLASQLADSDPAEAMKIAEQSLEKGLNYQLPNVLSSLLAKDKDIAQKLAGEILDRLRSENIAKSNMAAEVALSLLRMAVGNGEAAEANAAGSKAVEMLDEKLISDLMEMVVTAAMNPAERPSADESDDDDSEDGDDASGSHLLAALKTMLPAVQRYAPTKYSGLKSKLDGLEKKTSPREKAEQEYQHLLEQGSLDALLEAAAKAPPERRESVYMQVAYKAASEGDFERARNIVSEHISDPNRSKQVLAQINQQALWRSAQEGKLDQARQMLSRMPADARASALVNFTNAALGKGDKKLALQLLDEARGLIGPIPSNAVQLQTQISMVSTYASLDPVISFALLEALIDQLNHLLSTLAVLDGFEYVRHFREGELVNQTSSQVIMQSFHCARSLSSLARSDFDRAKACAGRFQRPELRATARLQVAQGILSSDATKTIVRSPVFVR